jgi:hypothetical protein
MPQLGFKPTIPMFKQTKIFHALDCVTIVIGINTTKHSYFSSLKYKFLRTVINYTFVCMSLYV